MYFVFDIETIPDYEFIERSVSRPTENKADLLELASDIDEKDEDEIFACLHDEEDIKGFLQDLESEIMRSIEARKDRK